MLKQEFRMQDRRSLRDTCARWLAVALGAVILAGCTVKESQHGNQMPQRIVAALKERNVTQDRVLQLLGTPTSESAFDKGVWYYVSEVQQAYAFFQPQVVERKVLILRFDDQRVLKSISTLDKTAGKEVLLVERETPTEGHKLGLLEQLLGNIGRFNSAAK
jgi:outer membrane protein assembly factor BamE (lipoprotein component of BamABCDE complex)